MASGVTNFITETLRSRDCLGYSIQTITNQGDCLGNLISLLHQKQLSAISLRILQILCNTQDDPIQFVNNDGLETVSELLQYGTSKEEQAIAVSLLLALCLCSSQYRNVLTKGLIPTLVHVSVNGNRQAKKDSILFLQLLRNHRTYATDTSSG